MSTGRNDIEDRLISLLRQQADSVSVPEVAWTEVRTRPATVTPLPCRSPLLAIGTAAAVAACLVVAAALSGDDRTAQVRTGPAAQEATPPAAVAAPSVAQLRAETRQVSLVAGGVAIDAGGRQFVGVQPMEVYSDPGDATYTTLELTWQEHGVEMRLHVYFTSDGRDWWSNEIRTYNGSAEGDWITYTGEFFRRPLGTPFTGDLTVETPEPGVGKLRMTDIRLEAFRPPPECATATSPLVLDPGTSPITIEGSNGYGVTVRLLDRATCAPVADQDRYAYDWDTADPAIVTVGGLPATVPPLPRHADLSAVGPGRTTVHVTARNPATGAIVAETDIEVVVGEMKPPPAPAVERAPSVP